MKELLQTIKGSHRVLLIACAASIVLFVSTIQRTAHDDALDELRTLSTLRNFSPIENFLVRTPEAMNSLPVLMDCYEADTTVSYYLSRLCGTVIKGSIGGSCQQRVGYLLTEGVPDSDSLSVWMNWLDDNESFRWWQCDENRHSWSPRNPSEISDSLELAGTGFGWLHPNPDYEVFGSDRYEKILKQEFTFIPYGTASVDHPAYKCTLSIPAKQTSALYSPVDWLEDKGFTQNISHRFGDSAVVLGGVKTLGLKDEGLTISGAISRVQLLREPDRSVGIWGKKISDPLATFLAPIALILLQLNLLFHCRKLSQTYDSNHATVVKQFPWISLYNDYTGLLYSIVTIAILPVSIIGGLVWSGFGGLLETVTTFGTALVFGLITGGIGYHSGRHIHFVQRLANRDEETEKARLVGQEACPPDIVRRKSSGAQGT